MELNNFGYQKWTSAPFSHSNFESVTIKKTQKSRNFHKKKHLYLRFENMNFIKKFIQI